MKLWVFVVRRLLLLAPVLIGVLTVLFSLWTLQPPVQDRLYVIFGPSRVGYNPYVPCTELGIDQPGLCPNPAYWHGVSALGLDQPIPVQWAHFVANSLTGNWGYLTSWSYASKSLGVTQSEGVSTLVATLLPYTIELAALAFTVTFVLLFAFLYWRNVFHGRALGRLPSGIALAGVLFTGFLVAYFVLIAVFAAVGPGLTCGGGADAFQSWYGSWPSAACFPNHQFPAWVSPIGQTSPTGFPVLDAFLNGSPWIALDLLRRLVLPAIVIGVGSAAVTFRIRAGAARDEGDERYLLLARAKGLTETEVSRHHLWPNVTARTVASIRATFAAFLLAIPLVEYVFWFHGVGAAAVYSIERPIDYGLLFGVALTYVLVLLAGLLVIDILAAVLDPRLRSA